MLRFYCPECDTTLEFEDDVRGTVVSCHSCDGKFRIPAANAPSAPPPLLTAGAGPPPIPPAPEDWPDLAPEPYHADGGMASAGSLVVLGICLVVSVLLGALASFIGQWFYLILVFPVAIGFGVGMAGVLAVYWGKVRAPWWAGRETRPQRGSRFLFPVRLPSLSTCICVADRAMSQDFLHHYQDASQARKTFAYFRSS